ncbi:hypothetical protein GJ496_005973 [Pomphorhynchus laevis]|nr:hypothetical protein GJ496_005973 [Pomphorhynchus laevis]
MIEEAVYWHNVSPTDLTVSPSSLVDQIYSYEFDFLCPLNNTIRNRVVKELWPCDDPEMRFFSIDEPVINISNDSTDRSVELLDMLITGSSLEKNRIS